MPDQSEFCVPFRMDIGALPLGEYVVLDCNFRIVRMFDICDEAERFIATANGEDVATVRRNTEKRVRLYAEYRDNLKRGTRDAS